MKDEAYIVLNSRGISRMTRKSRPKLAQGEYAVRLELTVPDHVFVARPIAQATLAVNAEKLLVPSVDVTQADIPPEVPKPLTDDPDYQAGLQEG